MTFFWLGMTAIIGFVAYLLWANTTSTTLKSDNLSIMKENNIPKDSLPAEFKDITPIYLEFNGGNRYNSPNGMMIFEDGTILRYSDFTTTVENGKLNNQKAELKWRVEAKITEKGVNQIKELIADFKPEKNTKIDPNLDVLVKYNTLVNQGSVYINGSETPVNYEFFTKVNRCISLNIIPKNGE